MASQTFDDQGRPSPVVSYNEPQYRSIQVTGSAQNLTLDTTLVDRVSLFIQSLSTNTASVFIGFDDQVTDVHNGGTGGAEIPPGGNLSLDLAPSSQGKIRDVYAFAPSGQTVELRILEL